MQRIYPASALCLLLLACANRPESIHASYVSAEKYSDLNCPQLMVRRSEIREDLEKYSKLQDSKANTDALGVFLIGVPVSKLSGDHEGEIARLKGEIEAVDTALVKAGCKGQARAPQLAAATPSTDVARKMALLLDLKNQSLISEDEFQSRRQKLLDEFMLGGAGSPANLRPEPEGQGLESPPLANAAKLEGLRFWVRDADPVSGASAVETEVHISRVGIDGYELNGGAIVLDSRGIVMRGTLPGLVLVGVGGERLLGQRELQTRLAKGTDMPAAEVNVEVLGEDVTRLSGRDIDTVRVRVTGYSPRPTALAGTTLYGNTPGMRISGVVMIEPRTGLIVSGTIECRAWQYAMNRQVSRSVLR
jgi:hypothetical protein